MLQDHQLSDLLHPLVLREINPLGKRPLNEVKMGFYREPLFAIRRIANKCLGCAISSIAVNCADNRCIVQASSADKRGRRTVAE